MTRSVSIDPASLVEACAHPLYAASPDGALISWNPAAARIYGWTASEATGRPLATLAAPERAHELEALLSRVRAGESGVEAPGERLCKDGSRVRVIATASAIRDSAGQLSAVCLLDRVVIGDGERALFLRDRAIQCVSQGIVITDARADNRLIFVSPGFERITGYTAAELIGRNCRLLQGPDTDREAVARVRAAIEAARPCVEVLLNYRKNGTSFWNELSISPVHDEQGVLTHFIGVQADVTERKRLEEQIHQSRKMEAVGQLAGGVAHEFNNQLTIIRGYCEMLAEELPPAGTPADGYAAAVQAIRKAANRSASLTRQLLAFGRREILQVRLVDPSEVLEGLRAPLRRMLREDMELRLELTERAGRVRVDPTQLEHAIVNLVANAQDAMPRGGSVAVATQALELAAPRVTAHARVPPGRYAVVAVSDNGGGMTPDVLARAFEPFFTTKPVGKGTGLGLAAVHGVMQQMGGHVEIESAPDAGTNVRLYFPVATEAPPSPAAAGVAPADSRTILLVEDEEDLRVLARRVLERAGYQVLEATDGEHALRQAAGHAGRIDALVTDVVMPRMDGRSLADQLERSRPGLVVVFCSGYSDDVVLRLGVSADRLNFIQKPYAAATLLMRLRELLASNPPPG